MEHHPGQSPEVALWLNAVQLHESPWLYTRWAALSAASAQSGRKIWIHYMHAPMHSNMYLMWVAPPAARKSTVLRFAMDMLKSAGHINFCPSDLTKVGLLRALKSGEYRKTQDAQRAKKGHTSGALAAAWDMADAMQAPFAKAGAGAKARGSLKPPEAEATYSQEALLDTLDDESIADADEEASVGSPLTIYTDELQVMFPRHSQEVFALLQDLYDGKQEYHGRDAIIEDPYITMQALLNPENLPVIFPHRALLSGLMSRMIFINAPKSNRKFNPFTAKGKMEAIDPMAKLLKDIGDMDGMMYMEKDAEQLYLKIENLPRDLFTADTRFENYAERRSQHLLKVCMNQALLCRRFNITLEDVKYCHTLLAYTEVFMPEALGEYGFNRDANAQRSILQALAENPKGCTSQMLLAKCQHYVTQSDDLVPILQYLESAGLVKKVSPASKGHTGDNHPLYFKVGANLKKWTPQHEITVFPQYLEEWSLMID